MSDLKVQTSTSYQDYLIKSLADPKRASGYLEVTLEHEAEDPIPDMLRLVLSNVVESQDRLDRLSPHAKELHDCLARLLSDTKGAEIYGLIDLLAELGFRLAVIPKERLSDDRDSIEVTHNKD